MKKYLLLAGALTLLASNAHAQDNAVAVVALFNEGKQLMAQGKVAEACPKFLASYALEARIGTLMNLANCYEQNGQNASAWAKYTEAISVATKQGEKERADFAREHAAALEPKLSKVTIVVDNPPSGLEVKKDGVTMNNVMYGIALPMDPGDHKIEATAPGKKTWSTTLTVGKAGDKKAVAIPPLEDEAKAAPVAVAPAPQAPAATQAESKPETSSKASSPPSDSHESKGISRKTIGIIVAGVGVVGVGVGSVFGISALGKKSDSDGHCVGNNCDAIGTQLREDGRSAGTLSTVFVGVGLAAVAGGVVLWATAPSSSSSVSVSASVDSHSQGLLVKGVW